MFFRSRDMPSKQAKNLFHHHFTPQACFLSRFCIQMGHADSDSGEGCPNRWTTKGTALNEIYSPWEEILIECTVYKAINALFSLKSVTPRSLLDEPQGYSPTARPSDLYDVPQPAILHRGQRFFDQVYGKVSKRVMSQMDGSGTEDLGITARFVHFVALSRKTRCESKTGIYS